MESHHLNSSKKEEIVKGTQSSLKHKDDKLTALAKSLHDLGAEKFNALIANGQEIAAGNFGKIVLITAPNGKKAVVKIFKNPQDGIKEAKINEGLVKRMLDAEKSYGGIVPMVEVHGCYVAKYLEQSDLAHFLIKLSNAIIYDNETQPFIVKAFKQDPVKFLDLIAATMMSRIDDLHDLGYFHLDIAVRNFLVDFAKADKFYKEGKLPIKIADFGLSVQFVDKNAHLFLDPKTLSPFKWSDSLRLTDHCISILSERFSIKVAIITMLSLILGENKEDKLLNLVRPVTVHQDNEDRKQEHLDARYPNKLSNEEILIKYLTNAEMLASQYLSNPLLVDLASAVLQFIRCYKAYLTYSPTITPNEKHLEKLVAEDTALFNKARENCAKITNPIAINIETKTQFVDLEGNKVEDRPSPTMSRPRGTNLFEKPQLPDEMLNSRDERYINNNNNNASVSVGNADSVTEPKNYYGTTNTNEYGTTDTNEYGTTEVNAENQNYMLLKASVSEHSATLFSVNQSNNAVTEENKNENKKEEDPDLEFVKKKDQDGPK